MDAKFFYFYEFCRKTVETKFLEPLKREHSLTRVNSLETRVENIPNIMTYENIGWISNKGIH